VPRFSPLRIIKKKLIQFIMNRDVQAGFEILTAVVMKLPIFWDATPCSTLAA
jgi:hypothetical protein